MIERGDLPPGAEHDRRAPWRDDDDQQTYYCNLCGLTVVQEPDDTCNECLQHIADTAPPNTPEDGTQRI